MALQFTYDEDVVKPPSYIKPSLEVKERLYEDILHQDIEELALAKLRNIISKTAGEGLPLGGDVILTGAGSTKPIPDLGTDAGGGGTALVGGAAKRKRRK